MRLLVHEIYLSIQGESSFSGWPCVFVRLTGCDLRCAWCDSAYAFSGGESLKLDEVLRRVKALDCPLVEITGGEPLLQKGAQPLMTQLADAGQTVLLETSGAHDMAGVDPRVIRIMDWKCPSSGESHRNLAANLACLTARDEIKFVIGDRNDYEWARAEVRRHDLAKRVRCVLFSPAFFTVPVAGQIAGHAGLAPVVLVEWMLEDQLPVRFQLQIHKHIWTPTQRGV